jgi:hypothetical protein
VYLTQLTMQNFRCFPEAELALNYPGRRARKGWPQPRLANVNLFVGGNGAGKSSVFKAVALGILAPVIQSSGFNAEFLVRRRPPGEAAPHPANGQRPALLRRPADDVAEIRAHIRLAGQDRETGQGRAASVWSRVEIYRRGDHEEVQESLGQWEEGEEDADVWSPLFHHDSPAFFLAAYGAGRRSERPEGYSEGSRSPRYQRVAGVFEEHVGMVPFTFGHAQIGERGLLPEARALLNSVLPPAIELTDQTDGVGRPLFARQGILLPFPALSDGFRAFVGWVWDLLYQLARVVPASRRAEPGILRDLEGVVIVDEVDLFLHPEWQRLVVEQVATAFPHLQFLLSSHSPLVAGSLEAANLFVLDGRGIERGTAELHGLTPNQVLTGPYFGLRSTRAPGLGTLGAAPSAGSEELAEPLDATREVEGRLRRLMAQYG